MEFASYGRKSAFNEKSDSIKNQHRMNRDYADMHFPGQISTFSKYADEGLTGANTKRPDLQRLLKDIELGKVQVLIVYQIDRLSRDIKDFANIYTFLELHKVMFVSIKENIDTSTPLGKAMMYIAVVFAQMERETIAERVTDNMIGLADSGWWVGGNPPLGWRREKMPTPDGRHHVTIAPVAGEVEQVKDIFNIFIDRGFSLQQMETHFKHTGIRTNLDKFFSTSQIHKLLTQPYCVEATGAVYDFYQAKGCNMLASSPRELWDGSRGVMIYGRSSEKSGKHQLCPPENWRVCLGKHKGFMSADIWLKAQEQLSLNVFNKTTKYDAPLLKGVLRCSCGRLMSVSRKKKLEGVSSWYYCPKRSRQGETYCSMSQIKTDKLDSVVVDILKSIEHDPEELENFMPKNLTERTKSKKVDLQKKLTAEEGKISNLIVALADNTDTTAAKYIIAEIDRRDKIVTDLIKNIAEIEAEDQSNKNVQESADSSQRKITNFVRDFDAFTSAEKNKVVLDIIGSCIWDGQELRITL